MSRLIDQLRESDFPDRSARDLTLEIGQWLEGNRRGDVFNANPDFAQEYYALKDEIGRAKRPGYVDEFKGAFGSAVDELQASGYAIGALAAHGAKEIGIPGAESVRNNLIRLMREQEDEAKSFQPSVGSYEQISGAHPIEDTLRYVTQGLGTVAPSMLQAAVSGLAGAAVGAAAGSAVEPGGGTVVGGVGGALMGLAERKLAQKAVSKLLERGIKNVTLEEAAKALPKEAIVAEAKRLAVQYGGQAALAASSIAQEVGSIYGDNPDAAGTAIAFGTAAGLLDVLPESYVLSRFFRPGEAVKDAAANKALAYFKRFATEAAKTVPMEGSTEAAQTLLEIAAGKFGRGEPATFTAADMKQAANAGIIGAIGGLAMAPVAAGPSGIEERGPGVDRLTDAVGERLPLRDVERDVTPGAQTEFGGEIPEQDLISRRTLGPDARGALAAAERLGFEGFNPGEEAPYQTGAAELPPGVELPKSVAKAIARAEDAVRPFVDFDAALPLRAEQEKRPVSEIITDAPLANLIGTEVEYAGYRGKLVRDNEGNFMVLPAVRDNAKPFWVEVTGTSKDPATMASEVALTPLEPPRLAEKPAPPTPPIPGAAPRPAAEASKVPLGEFFRSDLAPRQDIVVPNRTQPGEVLAAAQPSTPVTNATQEGIIAQNDQLQREGTDAQRAPAETGGGDRVAASGQSPAPGASATAEVAPATPKVAAPAPTVATRPTDAQVEGATNNVPTIPQDSLPNLRRLRIFTQPKVATEEDEGPVPAPRTVESQALDENPLVALDKAVGKLGKGESNVAAVIVDRQTGQAFVRAAYRGAGNTLYVDLSSTRKGTAVGKGSTVSATADFLRGTEGRPAAKLFAERMADGQPRFGVWGIGELSKPGKLANWNVGPAQNLETHPALQEAAKRWWTDQAKARPTSRATMPPATVDIEEFPAAMANWRRQNPGEAGAKAMATRIREYAEAQNKKFGGRLQPAKLDAWAVELGEAIEQMASTQEKQAVLLSADYTVPTSSTLDLFRSTIRALTESRAVDVAAFEQGLMGALDSAAKTTGLVIDPGTGRKIVAFALGSVNGPVNADTILSLLHEAAHVVTDGLAEPLRVAFQEAVDRMGWRSAPDGRGRWLMNPRSLDIRLLANADPKALSLEQRAALEQLTAEEIAAARRIDPATLLEEQMAEHLAQFGWDRAEAKGAVAKFVRFVKELWLKLAIAVQTALKGADNISPQLARAYVENRYLQFINRDGALARDRINDLLNWIGVAPTERQLIPVFPASTQWDQRMQYVDVGTGQLIPVAISTYTPESQLAFLKTALDNAARFVRDNPNATDTPQFRQTKRAVFSAPLSFTPSLQTNTVFAAINLEDEIYARIAAEPSIAPLLPPRANFHGDWLKLPDKQLPANRRAEAEAWAKSNKDPLTGAPIDYRAEITVDELPTADEPIVDREGKPVVVKLTEAQDKALQQTINALNDTQSRVQRRINYEVRRIEDLEKQRKKNPADFPEAALKELDELNESLPLRLKIAAALDRQRNALVAKFQPGDLVNIYPTAPYFTVPSPDASEGAIRKAPKGIVPRDLKFTDKVTFANHLSAMEAWLLNAENRTKGQIYGIISEQYRKLMQIPTDLERAGTAAIFRRAVTGSFADELRASGLPSLQNLAKKFFEVASIINAHGDDVKVSGDKWSTAFADFARALGSEPDQAFKERVWDPLMRVWNFIDVSERNRLGTEAETDLFATMEKALRTAAGVEVDTAPKRAALRGLLMATIDNERQIRTVYEQQPGLKVRDEQMGIYRRLVSHGLVTGRRGVARHMSGLFMRMNPVWSDTKPIGPEDVRTFWETAGDLYRDNRAAFDAKMEELFPGYVITDFVEPLVNNNVQLFDVTDADGIVRKASLLRVRQAWSEADGKVSQFAERLHALEGGKPGDENVTVDHVMRGFARMFNEIKADQDAKNGTEALGHEILPRQMMDARVANDWPQEWVSYASYTKADNLTLLHQLARAAAFGPDAIAGSGELAATIREAKRDLDELYHRFDDLHRQGKSQREIEALMGRDDYRIAKNALKITANLDRVEHAFRTMSSNTNYLAGDFRLLNESLGFAATMMIQNPRGTLINTSDILGSLAALKLSTPALKAQARAIRTLAADLGNGILQAFGQNAAFNTQLALRRMHAGVKDPDIRTTWREKMNNYGPGLSLAAPSGYESPLAKTRRTLTRWAAKGRDIIPNLGSPLQGTAEMQTLSPKLRWGGFPNWAMSTMNANIDAAYETFADLAQRGVEYLNKIPAADRAQFVRELELGVRDLGADELGYFGGLILNDRAAFDSLRGALETKMAGESGVGRFVAKAYRRFEGAGGGAWEAISNSQFTDIVNYANTEWTLQNNFASLPPWMQSGPLRPLFIFLTWPYNAMRRFGKTFTDADGRLIWWGTNSTVADGMKAFFLLAAPATIAGSFAVDWYDKYLLGKKQNLRETNFTTAIPVVGFFTDPAAFVERVGRYGSAGFATDIINQIVNYDTQRNLSLDNRIVAVNALSSLVNSLVITPIQTRGNVTWASTGRPFFQAIGGGGVLQYLQIVNNALDLNNQDAAINARINTGNYLRAAGRELDLPIRVTGGASEMPNRMTPYLQQMELAALVNNVELFREAYRNAIEQARIERPDDAEKYVADNFNDRHPLRRLFRTSPSEGDYRKMLSTMDEYGAGQVRAAINSYNRYLTNWFGKKAYYGRADKGGESVEQLIRRATRINSDLEHQGQSALAIP